MIIGKAPNSVVVILADGEKIPQNLNSPKTVIFRRGESTNRELRMVKPLGELASDDLISTSTEKCNYADTNPMHQHADGSWWFYEANRKFENGPYETYDLAYDALEEYCEMVIKLEDAMKEVSECSEQQS